MGLLLYRRELFEGFIEKQDFYCWFVICYIDQHILCRVMIWPAILWYPQPLFEGKRSFRGKLLC